MKLVSWNVAGYRACLKKGFEDFFNQIDADIFCLQETKATMDQIPFHPEGYFEYLNTAEKKGYSGTMVYSRIEPLSVSFDMGVEEHDHEGRIICCEYEDFYLVNQYVPNVKRDLSRLDYRMKWEDDFREYLKKLDQKKPVVVCGDFNVAHNEIDIKNAKANIGNAGFTYEERGKFTELLQSGFIDTFRHF
ncbi:MAG: exodeoxyribonuclease III, partial [Erysipelotrichaceae bacterium]|nr:exodeoxyribonuclease III [Erysipelotrichaceae bacterium]